MAAVLGPLRPEEEKLFEGQPKGFPFEEFALEDVMLPEDDDMDIPSEEDSDEEEEIESESGFGSVIGRSHMQFLILTQPIQPCNRKVACNPLPLCLSLSAAS